MRKRMQEMSKMRQAANMIVAPSLGSRWRVAIRAIVLCVIGFGAPITGTQVALIGVAVETLILAIQETQRWRQTQ